MTSPQPPQPTQPPQASHPHRRRRRLAWLGGAVLVLLLLVGAAVWFLAGTQSGARWLFTRLGTLIPGSLDVAALTGPISGPLDIRGLVYKSDSLEVHVDHLQLDWRLRELLSRRLDVERLWADGVRIIPIPTTVQKQRGPLPDVNLRFNILLRDARVRDLKLGAASAPPFVVDSIELATTGRGNRFQIQKFAIRAPTLDGDVDGTFQPQGDYPVDLQVRWKLRQPGFAAMAGSGPLTGTLKRLRVVQALTAPFPAQLDAILFEPLYDLRFDGKAAFTGADPRLVKADLPDVPASGQVSVAGTLANFTSTGSVRGSLRRMPSPAIAGLGEVTADWRLARVAQASGDGWRIDSARVTLPGTPTRVDLKGLLTLRGNLPGRDVTFQGEAGWRDLTWPPRSAAPLVASSRGVAKVAGSLDAYRADVQADLTRLPGGDILPGAWAIAGSGDRNRFRFETLRGALLAGRLEGRGEVAWQPHLRWNAALHGDGINPGRLAAQFPGSLSFAATSRGALQAGGPVGSIQVPRIRGDLRGQPVAGALDLDLAGARYDLRRCDLTWGSATLAAAGRLLPTLDLTWNVSAPNLGIAVPQGGGSVLARGRVSGPAKAPRVEVNAAGEGIRFGTTSVARATVTGDVDLAPTGAIALDVRADGVQSGQRRAQQLTVEGRGTRARHTVTVAAVTVDGRLDTALTGGLVSTAPLAWSGQVSRLDLTAQTTGNWRLEAPAPLAASAAAVRLRGFCWRSGGARLCTDADWAKAGDWGVNATLADLPLTTFHALLPPDLRITGNLGGHVKANGRGAVLAAADVDLRPGPGELRFPGKEGETLTFRYEQGFVQARAGAGGTGEANAGVTLAGVGNVRARLDLPRFAPGTPLQSQPLAGRIDVNLSNLAFIQGFVPDITNPAGSLTGGYTLSGTLGDPRFVGAARLSGGSADVPQFGLKLRAFELTATGDGSGALAVDGSLHSGPGTLTIKGRAGVPGPQTPITLAIAGQRFQVSNTEEIRAVVSPDLKFTMQGKKASLTGQVTIPQAAVNIEKRPAKGPVKPSKDVVFVHAGAAPTPAQPRFALTAQVRVVVGDEVDVAALGLKVKPRGSVLVLEEPGTVTRGTGELELTEGTFKAYGQDLTIQRGRLIFGGGPISNPGLDVRAARTADDGTVAGIEAKGTVQQPQVTLWSDPEMSQSDQLAYLLLGHPLNQTQPQEGDRLANAATALGLRGGNMLAKKLASRFGLQEASFQTGTNGTLQSTSLVVGKYLSPRLYVSYGIGLFEPVNTFRIRYLVNKKLSLQAENTGVATGADALYTIER